MKSFLVIAQQGGGCDYTIACGINHYFYYAESIEELYEEIKKELMSDGDSGGNFSFRSLKTKTLWGSEQAIDILDIYELGEGKISVPLTKISKEYDESEELKKQAEKERKEYDKYIQLKNKFAEKIEVDLIRCKTCGTFVEGGCKPCKKEQSANIKLEQKKINDKVSKIYELRNLLVKHGWVSTLSGAANIGLRFKLDGKFQAYDKPVMKGNKQTFTWRRISLDDYLGTIKDNDKDKEIFKFIEEIKQYLQ